MHSRTHSQPDNLNQTKDRKKYDSMQWRHRTKNVTRI